MRLSSESGKRPARLGLFAALGLALALSARLSAVATLQNLAVGGTLLPGQAITVTFQITCNNGANPLRFALGVSDVNTMASGDDFARTNWLASNNTNTGMGGNGVFGAGVFWLDGVSQTVTNRPITDTWNFGTANNGIQVGNCNGGVWKNVSVVTRIPQELAGATYYLHVIAREFDIFGGCSNGPALDNRVTLPLAIGGTPTYAYDLDMCNWGSDPDATLQSQTRLNYRITNRGEAGVPITGFKWRFYFHDDGLASWQSQAGLGTQAFFAGGTAECGGFNSANYSLNPTALTDCGSGRTTNRIFEWTPQPSFPGGSAPRLLPAGGGYMESTQQIWFRPATGSPVNRTNDYSRPTDWPACGSPTTDQKWATLYYNNSLVCERSSCAAPGGPCTLDSESGTEPCNVTGPPCGATPTFTVTPTSTRTPTPSITPTRTATPTSTVTPVMGLTKSASVATAVFGQTLTFCMAWSNGSAGAVTMNFWDTISTFITYQGCDNACIQAGPLVRWSFPAAAGASGSVCFWGTVSGYP